MSYANLTGQALTKLAWELGLAPASITWEADCAYAYDEETEQAWRPWSRVAQADAVF